MLEWILFALSILGLAIATYTDLKERIIPNKLTFPLIALGIGLHAVMSFLQGSFTPLAFSAFAALAAFAFSYLLWKAGIWAGGDVKIFTALAALNPVNYMVLGKALNIAYPALEPLPLPFFFFTLFVFTIFAMFPYALILSLAGIVKSPKLRRNLFRSLIGGLPTQFFNVFKFVVLSLGAGAVFDFVGVPLWVRLFSFGFEAWLPVYFLAGLIFIWGLLALPKLVQYALLVVLFLIPLFTKMAYIEVLVNNTLSLLVLFFVLKALLQLLALNKEVLRKKVKVNELKEGDIPAETLVLKEGKVVSWPGLSLKTVLQAIKARDMGLIDRALKAPGKLLASSSSAAGLTEEQARELKAFAARGAMEKEILVKMTAPLAPAILIAFVALHIIGDWLWHLIV